MPGGVFCCIAVGGDPRTPLLRCAWLSCARKLALCIAVGEIPETFYLSIPLVFPPLSLSLLFANLPALREIHEAPHHAAVLKNPPASDASRLRRLESSRIALLF
jgi:hypothetical protein